jgi:hypothetical protein
MKDLVRGQYTLGFKQEAVRLVRGGEGVSSVAKSLGISFFGVLSFAAVSVFFTQGVALAGGTFSEPVAQALQAPASAPQPSVTTIFIARKIVAMEPKHPSGEAVAVSGKRIIAVGVGTLDQVKRALDDRPYKVDETFKSKIILPASSTSICIRSSAR